MVDTWQEEREREAHAAREARLVLLAHRRRVADLRELMQIPAFRRFVWKLLGECGTFRSSFNSDPSRMALNEGARAVGIALCDDLHEHCLEAYQAMEREARDDDARFDAAAVPAKDT